jgi:hypothetical protein
MIAGMVRTFSTFILLLLGCAQAAAQGAPSARVEDRRQIGSCLSQGTGAACIGTVAVPCVAAARGNRNEAEIACARREEAIWRERLTLASLALGRRLDLATRSQLQALQLGWQSYVVQKCAFYGALQPAERAAGRQAGCELREVAQRALEIERLARQRGGRPPARRPQIFR